MVNRPKPQLRPEHKTRIVNFFDDNSQARLTDVVDSLTHNFADLSIKQGTVHNLKTECNLSFKKGALQPAARNDSTKIGNRLAWVKQRTATDINYHESYIFVDESAFNSNMQPSGGWAKKRKPSYCNHFLYESNISYDFGRHFF